MKSPAKLLMFMERIQDLDDQELADAIPMISARVIRTALAAAARAVPADPGVLDHYLQQAGDLILAMRSDELLAGDPAPSELDGSGGDVTAELTP